MKPSRIERRLKRLRRRPLARLPFGAILGKASGNISWLLRDEFTTALAAGAVNGTAAEPGPGTRNAVEIDGQLSISGDDLVFPSQGTPTWGDMGLYYQAITRVSGRLLLSKANVAATNKDVRILGWYDDQAVGANDAIYHTYLGSDANIYVEIFDGAGVKLHSIVLGAYSAATDYRFAIILRATGAYVLIKGGVFTNWLLIYIIEQDSTATLYPIFSNHSAIGLIDFFRIPGILWLPTPLAYDTFTRADGAPGNTEIDGPDGQVTPVLAWGGNGTINTDQLGVTPILGSELITDPAFDTGCGVNWACGVDWSIAAGLATRAAGVGPTYITEAVLTIGEWYVVSWDVATFNAGTFNASFGIVLGPARTSAATFTSTNRADGANAGVRANAAGDGDVDDVSFKQLTLTSTIAAVQATTLDTFTQAELTITDNTQAGLMLRLDDPDNPQAFVHIYTDRVGNNIIVADVTGAITYTVRSSTGFTYSAGAILVVDLEGTNYRVYYNDALIITGNNISTAAGAYIALFATDSATRFDNFLIIPKGSSDDEHSRLDRWSF